MSATNPPPATQTQPSQIHPTISQWNPQIVAEMDAAQRQHIVKTADHRDNGIPLGEYTRVICASLAPIPSKFVPNVRSRAATNGLQAACITIIPVLADIFLNKNLSGDELYRQLTVAAKTIAESFVLAAGVTCLEDVLRVKLEQQLRNPQFIDYVSKLSGPVASKATSTLGWLPSVALLLVQLFRDGGTCLASHVMGDTESAELHWEAFKSNLTPDALLPGAVVLGAASVVGPMVASGGILLQAGCWVLLGVTSTLADQAIRWKNARGGWMEWIYSTVFTDRRATEWSGAQFDLVEDQITDTLRCAISRRIPVHPMRSTRNGQLYDRSAIYAALDHRSFDPFDRKSASRLDYIPCPITTKWVHKVAKEFQAGKATI